MSIKLLKKTVDSLYFVVKNFVSIMLAFHLYYTMYSKHLIIFLSFQVS